MGFVDVRLLNQLQMQDFPRGGEVPVDARVFAFTLVVAVLTGILFGMIPVVDVLRRNLNEVFRQTGRTGTAERPALLTRSVLVVAQVSLAFVLLIGSVLLIASILRLSRVDPGFPAGPAAYGICPAAADTLCGRCADSRLRHPGA